MTTVNAHLIISMFHIFIVVPFFLYVAFQRASVPLWIYWTCLVVGIILAVYHGVKAYLRWVSKNPMVWINAFHFLIVAPVLIAIGSYQYDTPRYLYELLKILGFGALGYHFFSIAEMVQEGSAVRV